MAVSALQAAAADYFYALRKSLIRQIGDAIGKASKVSEEIERKVQRILDDLDFEGYESFADIVRSELETLFADAAGEAATQVGYSLGVDAFALANKAALKYARDRAAEMVGMKWVGDEMVPNPNAKWQISDGTREMLRSDVRDAMADGWSNDRLAQELADNYAFSDQRAETVARTETARADVQGSLEGYRAAGVEKKRWLTAPGCCDECQDLDGEEVGIDDQFPNDGGDGAPLHPNCRCDVLPVLEEE